jgi:hypothetical protein
MDDPYTEVLREPISFSAAPPGWRALFVDEAQDRPGSFVLPLIGWSLFRITIRDADTGDQLPKVRTELEGVVLEADSFPVSVYDTGFDTSRFDSYLSPDQPDPEPGKEPGREKPDGGRRGPGRGRGRGRGRIQPPVFDPRPAGG